MSALARLVNLFIGYILTAAMFAFALWTAWLALGGRK